MYYMTLCCEQAYKYSPVFGLENHQDKNIFIHLYPGLDYNTITRSNLMYGYVCEIAHD